MGVPRNDATEHAYIVAYDIADAARWRQVFKTMKGYGQRLQLSVWHCRLGRTRRIELAMKLEAVILREEDHVVIADLGPAGGVTVKIESIGKVFEPIERRATII